MSMLLQIFAFLFAIGLLVTLHELGHFWMATLIGVKVLRFSIGFGKPLWRHMSKAGTEYVIGMIPLGGYVKMLDCRDEPVAEQDKIYAFDQKPLPGRIAVVCMGPLVNFLIAIVAFWLIFVIGIQQIKPVIGVVLPDSIAAQNGLKTGQQILQVDNYITPSWTKVMIAVVLRMGETGYMRIKLFDPATQTNQTRVLNLNRWQTDDLNPDPLGSLGVTPYMPQIAPIIHEVVKGSPAQLAGLQVGDKILQVNNQLVNDWFKFIKDVQQYPAKTLTIKLQRGQKILVVPVLTGEKRVKLTRKIGYLGVAGEQPHWPADMKIQRQYSLLGAWVPAWQETVDFTAFNARIIGKMVIGQLSLKGLGGPIAIFTSSSMAFKEGLIAYISFLAIFSLMLAFVNILPIPGLDGGHLLYFFIESLRGKPLQVHTQVMIWRIGITILVVLMFQATINDLLRLL